MDKEDILFSNLREINQEINFEDINTDEIISNAEADMNSLLENINNYKSMVSQLELVTNDIIENEAIDELTDEYLEIIDFMQELYGDINEAVNELKNLITANKKIFINANFDSQDFEKNTYKYSIMIGYILSLMSEYDDFMENISENEEDFDDLIKFIKENKDLSLFKETDEFSDDEFFEEVNNKMDNIINFDDFNELEYSNDFYEDDENQDDEFFYNIKSEIDKYEKEINSITEMLINQDIEEDFIYKITKRYMRFISKLKNQMAQNEDDNDN